MESVPKQLFTQLPVVHIQAMDKKKADALFDPSKYYDCPVYTRPKRTGQSFVFMVKLPTQGTDKPSHLTPEHWTLRGVAVLCSKD